LPADTGHVLALIRPLGEKVVPVIKIARNNMKVSMRDHLTGSGIIIHA
jgi:hypothetical protein